MSRAQFFLVVVPMLWPVPARAGDVVVVRRGAPIPVSVVRRTRGQWRVVYQADTPPDDVQAAHRRGHLDVMPDARAG